MLGFYSMLNNHTKSQQEPTLFYYIVFPKLQGATPWWVSYQFIMVHL